MGVYDGLYSCNLVGGHFTCYLRGLGKSTQSAEIGSVRSVKVSLLLLYYQLSPIESYRRIVYIFGGIITAHTVAAELVGFHRLNLIELVNLQCFQVSVFECRPVGVLWNHNFTESTRCINIPAFLTANASLNALSDVVIWFMPIPIILTLRINYRKKSEANPLLQQHSPILNPNMVCAYETYHL
jgi:hypothetical protein